MFDWDEQELANIIWGEDSEAGDHIVPFPDDIENKDLLNCGNNDKRTLNEEDTKGKADERILCTSNLVSKQGQGKKNEGVSASGIAMDTQLELPSFATPQVNDNSIALKTELDIDPEVSGYDEDKELGELVGNSWANIECFDDLDQIFSNDELDGPTSLDNADALWSSSKELISGTAKTSSTALGSRSWEFGDLGNSFSLAETNSEYLNKYPSVPSSCGKVGITSSYTKHISSRLAEHQEYTADVSPLIEEKTAFGFNGKTTKNYGDADEFVIQSKNYSNKEDWSKHQSQHGEISNKVGNSRLSGYAFDAWPSSAIKLPQYGRGCTPATMQAFPAPLHGQKQLSKEFLPVAYQHFTNTYASPSAYGNFPQQYSAKQVLRPNDNECQSILSGSEGCRGDVPTARLLKMTPQEKIEKLRRRQQMQAMLAIQKQQQQLDHQVSSVDYPLSQKNYQEDQMMHMGKPDLEDDESLATMPCYDPGSPNKMDDISTISDVDKSPVEDTVLYHLQDIIARLDVKIRLCIKDSLYRLSHSAAQRHSAGGTSSAQKSDAYDPDVAKEEMSSHYRAARNANVETETNQMDRAVAHLLFHRPFKSAVKHADSPDSSTSNRLSSGQEMSVSKLPSALLERSSENDSMISPSGSKRPFVDTCQEDVLTSMSEAGIKAESQTEPGIEHAD